MNIIEVRSVAKRYRASRTGAPRTLRGLVERTPRTEHWALRDVSFTLARGEVLGLVGANGSGKSTLLRLLARLTRPTRGDITVRGEVSGLLTLGDGLQPILTAEENVRTGAILAGLTRSQAESRLHDVAAFAELEANMDQPLRTFSDGMRLRLAFATAIHVDPEILLIDEILAVGDLQFQEKCLRRIEELRNHGVTIAVASHDLSTIERLCERAVWLADGELREIGHVGEVLEHYRHSMRGSGDRSPSALRSTSRFGTREVEITGVRLLDGFGDPTGGITAGGSLTVEVSFLAHRAVEEVVFSVTISNDHNGLRCLDLSTRGDGRTIGPVHGRGTITLQLDRIDLSGGEYHVSVGAYPPSWSPPFDYLWQALPLRVVALGMAGLLQPPHSWKLDGEPSVRPVDLPSERGASSSSNSSNPTSERG